MKLEGPAGVTKLPAISFDQLIVPEKGITLLKRPKKFQSKESQIPSGILTQDLGGNGRSFTGDNTGLGRGGRGNGQMNDLVWAKKVGRSNTGTHCTTGHCRGGFDELHACSVSATQE